MILTTSLKDEFLALKTRRDLARILEIDYSLLVYHIYKIQPKYRYARFMIPKKSGGHREIFSPSTKLNLIQKKLSLILNQVYEPKASVHGFVLNKNIVTNAYSHTNKKLVFNIDIKDFFPSITFARTRGIFMSKPFSFNEEVATVIAQICCYKDKNTDLLPQGAPTSPIITNIICSKMDKELLRFAESERCTYTRYADDISFSTNLQNFEKYLVIKTKNNIKVGKKIKDIINDNGFRINEAKVRLYSTKFRQEVTGLTVNKFPNVRRKYIKTIRGMINAWRKYGEESAQLYFKEKYMNIGKGTSFKKVLRGRIEFVGMVRGKLDFIYLKYLNQFNELAGLRKLEITNPRVDISEIGKEFKILNDKYTLLENEVQSNIEPRDFSYIHESHNSIISQLNIDNRAMIRAINKNDFQGFCVCIVKQLESAIKKMIRSHLYPSIETFISNDQQLRRILFKRPIHYNDLVHLIRLSTEYWMSELSNANWINNQTNYAYHDLINPTNNHYCMLHYVREIRNLEHREGETYLDDIKRLELKKNEKEMRIAELRNMPTPNQDSITKETYNMYNTINSIAIYNERNFELIENILYDFIRVILSDPETKLNSLNPPSQNIVII